MRSPHPKYRVVTTAHLKIVSIFWVLINSPDFHNVLGEFIPAN